jgi:hypothetical protein
MSRRADAPYFQGDSYQAVALGYKGNRVELESLPVTLYTNHPLYK